MDSPPLTPALIGVITYDDPNGNVLHISPALHAQKSFYAD
jgi:hypothetical protein